MLRISITALLLVFGPALAAPARVPSSQPIPPKILNQMYRRELGSLYRAGDAQKLLEVHQLIEQYFAATAMKDREQIARSIEATGIDANIVGRLTRLHMDWPVLVGGVYYINEHVGPHNVHYFLGIPRTYDRTMSWPLVIK